MRRTGRLAAADQEGRSIDPLRAWPLRTYFLLLLGVFVVVAGLSLAYIHVQTQDDAEDAAHKHARFAATVAAGELGRGLALVNAQVVQLANATGIEQVFTRPKACALQSSNGHIDVLDSEGRVACSSIPPKGKPSYGREEWFARAMKGPILVAPVKDVRTGVWSLIRAAPLPKGRGVAIAVINLEVIGSDLARQYSGGEPFLFTVTDGKRILIRSQNARQFIGKPLLTFRKREDFYTATDRQGVKRFFAQAQVPGIDWRFVAGEELSAAVAPAEALERRQFTLVLVGFLLMLGATLFAYWAVASPIAKLRRAVQGEDGSVDRLGGPKEVTALGHDISEMVQRTEMRQREERMSALGSLASGVAHDFNNVLLVIRTHADRLLRRPLDDQVMRHGVEQIDSAAARGAELAHQLLAFSRTKAVKPAPTDVNEVVSETAALLERVLGANIELHVDLEDDLPPVLIDRGQLSQVVLNLAINARDAMAAGGKLTITTRRIEKTDTTYETGVQDSATTGHVVLEVRDTGIGMDEATRERAFEPFFTTKGDGGTGLGLATVFGIVHTADGVISIESQPGQGAVFRVLLPITKDPAALPEALAEDETLRGDETILLVEDEDLLRPLIADTLRFFGYTVIEAKDGEEAMAAQRSHATALVLCDVVLPTGQGDDVVSALLAAQPDLEVLFTSGFPRHDAHPLVPESHFIAKPYTPDELARKIREVLDS